MLTPVLCTFFFSCEGVEVSTLLRRALSSIVAHSVKDWQSGEVSHEIPGEIEIQHFTIRGWLYRHNLQRQTRFVVCTFLRLPNLKHDTDCKQRWHRTLNSDERAKFMAYHSMNLL